MWCWWRYLQAQRILRLELHHLNLLHKSKVFKDCLELGVYGQKKEFVAHPACLAQIGKEWYILVQNGAGTPVPCLVVGVKNVYSFLICSERCLYSSATTTSASCIATPTEYYIAILTECCIATPTERCTVPMDTERSGSVTENCH